MSEAKKALLDQAARDRIRHDFDHTLFVEASAGSGKTTELVERIVGLVREGKCRISELVAVTFTEKAAGEMKLRLRTSLERARLSESDATQKANVFRALAELEVAHIGTIHAFCADLLRERPIEACVDPLFEVADGGESDAMAEEAFRGFFERALEDPRCVGIRRLLRRRPKDRGASASSVLFEAGKKQIDHRDFRHVWKRPTVSRTGELGRVRESIASLAALFKNVNDRECYLTKSIEQIALADAEIRMRENVRGIDLDALESDLHKMNGESHWRWKGWGRKAFADGITKDEIRTRREQVKLELEAVLERVDADLAAEVHEELWPLVDAYEEEKKKRGKLDFLDLLLLTRNLLRDDAAVRRELQGRFRYLLVDEFQDTDPLQAEILLLLAANDASETDFRRAIPKAGKLFCVGDPKQAIYRFRRADVQLYASIKETLVSRGAAEVVYLTTSFRSVPALQDFVNATFEETMKETEDGSQAAYVPQTPFREPHVDGPAVIALPVPHPYGDYGLTKYSLEASYAEAVGAFVAYLTRDSGFTVEENGARVPIAPRHVCLLFRRFVSFGDDTTRPYVAALEAHKVPHVLVGGRAFHDREEISALTNVLTAVEHPEDEFSVYAVLRGPFFAFTDDVLFAFRDELGSLHPRKKYETPPETFVEVVGALGILRKLHYARNRRPIAETLVEFLEATRAQAQMVLWPNGERALANVARFVDLARSFERRGATSFRAFLRQLARDKARGGTNDAPVVEEGADGVRMMTVHRAKGLEFPVVILVDLSATTGGGRPSRYLDASRDLFAFPLANCTPLDLLERKDEILRHDREESLRLSYVAATRARDMIVVPVLGDAPHNLQGGKGGPSWCDDFGPAVYPDSAHAKFPIVAPYLKVPFKRDSVLDRKTARNVDPGQAIVPGIHRARKGNHFVLVWDPALLPMGEKVDTGLRYQRLLAKAEGALHAATEGERIHAEWKARRDGANASGSAPTFPTVTVSMRKVDPEAASAAPGKTPVEIIPRTEMLSATTPSGERFGTLVHAVLAVAPLAYDAETVNDLTKFYARTLGATDEEVEAALATIKRALEHAVFERARNADEVRRETWVSIEDEGTTIEGVLDLAFREGDHWVVVDYKTDRDLAPRLDSYRLQVGLYARALEGATGLPTQGIVFQL